LCCFRSLLLTASHLISFPAGTKTFQFPAFPILSDHFRKSMKSHSGISGSTCTCHSPEHTTACHTLHQYLEPSPPSNSVRSLLHLCTVSSTWIAIHILYQPFRISLSWILWLSGFYDFFKSGPIGIWTRGPRLTCLVMQGRCSTRLSYGPILCEYKKSKLNLAIVKIKRRWSSRRFPYGYLVTT
jgi:hypothetical protein